MSLKRIFRSRPPSAAQLYRIRKRHYRQSIGAALRRNARTLIFAALFLGQVLVAAPALATAPVRQLAQSPADWTVNGPVLGVWLALAALLAFAQRDAILGGARRAPCLALPLEPGELLRQDQRLLARAIAPALLPVALGLASLPRYAPRTAVDVAAVCLALPILLFWAGRLGLNDRRALLPLLAGTIAWAALRASFPPLAWIVPLLLWIGIWQVLPRYAPPAAGAAGATALLPGALPMRYRLPFALLWRVERVQLLWRMAAAAAVFGAIVYGLARLGMHDRIRGLTLTGVGLSAWLHAGLIPLLDGWRRRHAASLDSLPRPAGVWPLIDVAAIAAVQMPVFAVYALGAARFAASDPSLLLRAGSVVALYGVLGLCHRRWPLAFGWLTLVLVIVWTLGAYAL